MLAKMPKVQALFRLYLLPSFVLSLGIFFYSVLYVKVGVERDFDAFIPSIKPFQTFAQSNQAPLLPQATPEVAPKEQELYSVKVAVLNVRSKPTTDSVIKAKLYHSDEIAALEVQGDWVRTDFGWVKMEFLRAV